MWILAGELHRDGRTGRSTVDEHPVQAHCVHRLAERGRVVRYLRSLERERVRLTVTRPVRGNNRK